MLSLWDSIILGLVEGFTEFLPISSTAHLTLVSDLLGLTQSDYLKTFAIAIQSGAILAVLVLYFRRFLEWETLKRLAAAFVPTGILGLLFYSFVKDELIGNIAVTLWSLAIGGMLMILFEKFHIKKDPVEDVKNISYGRAMLIGLAQSIAMIPGVSRAGATIIGGMLLGLRRELIVEFSFLLAVPTMFAATGLDLAKNAEVFSSDQIGFLAVGLAASFITAVISIKFLLAYVRRHSFTAFGVYRILLVGAFILLVL